MSEVCQLALHHRLEQAAVDIQLLQYSLVLLAVHGMHRIRLYVVISKAVILYRSSFHIVQLSWYYRRGINTGTSIPTCHFHYCTYVWMAP